MDATLGKMRQSIVGQLTYCSGLACLRARGRPVMDRAARPDEGRVDGACGDPCLVSNVYYEFPLHQLYEEQLPSYSASWVLVDVSTNYQVT